MIALTIDQILQPELTEINRLPIRPPLQPELPAAEPGTDGPDRGQRLSLDGEWQFLLADRPEAAPAGWHDRAYDASAWRAITVPGVWTLQDTGDEPIYSNFRMPFGDPHEPAGVPEDNPTGLYRTQFSFDPNWADQDIILHVGGFESVALIWCNDRFIGMGKDSRLPSEFDLTEALVEGQNLVAIMVIKWSDASWIEDQDHWRHGGLHRSVFVESRVKTRIDDLVVVADYEAADGSGSLAVRARVTGPSHDWSVAGWLEDEQGQQIIDLSRATVAQFPHDGTLMEQLTTSIDYGGHEAELSGAVESVRPWSAEQPARYRLCLTLRDGADTIVETHRQWVGFRRSEIRDRRLLVNGEPVIIIGVNRHDHHPVNGKTVSLEDMRADLVAMKRHNINAVRTAHYPNDHRLLDLADELGLYVVDEANVECHARAKAVSNDPRYQKAIVDRTRRMIMRDRNHPCIIGWSLGNEAGHGPAHDAAAALARRLDPTRFIQYEGAVADRFISFWSDPSSLSRQAPDRSERVTTDVVCPMYPPLDLIVSWARWAEESKEDDRPLIMCEYSHAMGNSNGSLTDYVDAFYAEPALGGGFVWEWQDHGLAKTDDQGRFFWAYGGHFGEERHDGNFCCDGLVGPDREPHPGLREYMWAARPVVVTESADGRFLVRNRRHFSGTDDLLLRWSVQAGGETVETGEMHVAVAAQQEAVLTVPYQTDLLQDVEMHLTTEWVLKADSGWADAGHRVAWDQLPLSMPPAPPAVLAIPSDIGAVSDKPLQLRLDRFGIDVDDRGMIARVLLDNQPIIDGDVSAAFWRAPIDNDGVQTLAGDIMPSCLADWYAHGFDRLAVEQSSVRFAYEPEQETLLFERIWSAGLGPKAVHRSRWRLTEKGIAVDEELVIPDQWTDMPRVGIGFMVPAGFEQLEWTGLGPEESYSDRYQAQVMGRWRSTVDGQYHPYCFPQEHGAHHATRQFALHNGDGGGFSITLPQPLSFSARHHHDADLTAATTLADLVRQDTTEVHIDAALRGVGTGACGPDALPPYRVGPGTYRFAWLLTATDS